MNKVNEVAGAVYRQAVSLTDARSRYQGFAPGSTLLRQGSMLRRGALPLPCNIVSERDVAMQLRDGTTIYVDIFRPAGQTACPAILAWSPYGKRGSTHDLDDFPGRAGIPLRVLSGLQKFEGPDPAYWCSHGYAVVNADPRGVCRSEGDIAFWGRQEGRDGHDVIEWLATLDWCNGKVALSGNSWLALAQWFIAAEQPPHLAAIAPWEGSSDFFRETACRGGIPDPGFVDWVVGALVGGARVEDPGAALRQQPFWSDYWADKRAAIERIQVPAYVVASWTNVLHVWGSLRGFRELSQAPKWLRVHDSHEWADYYAPQQVDDLRRFFDHYLKGLDNGWERTPPVRLKVLDPGHQSVSREEASFPLQRGRQRGLFLDAQGSLRDTPAPDAQSLRRQVTGERARFTYRFDRLTEWGGLAKLKLWVQANDADDLDLFVHLAKLDARGRVQPIPVIPVRNPLVRGITRWLYLRGKESVAALYTPGPTGRVRVSMRSLDPVASTALEPMLTLQGEERLQTGQIVPVEIALRPMAWRFHPGEQLLLEVAGHDIDPMGMPGVANAETRGRGTYTLHLGGHFDAQLLMDEVPAD